MRVKSHLNPREICYSRRADNKIKVINEKYIAYQFNKSAMNALFHFPSKVAYLLLYFLGMGINIEIFKSQSYFKFA